MLNTMVNPIPKPPRREKKKPKPLKRTPIRRSTTPIAKIGRVGKRKQTIRTKIKIQYFENHGWVESGIKAARCQVCGDSMVFNACNAHHKTPRGEGGRDLPENFICAHPNCHIVFLHNCSFGRPTHPLALERFNKAEAHRANVVNGLIIDFPQPVVPKLL